MIPPAVDKEGAATRVLGEAKAWLGTSDGDYAQGTALLETIANLLEAGEHVPMSDPPRARVLALAEAEGNESNRAELVRLLVLWSEKLAAASS